MKANRLIFDYSFEINPHDASRSAVWRSATLVFIAEQAGNSSGTVRGRWPDMRVDYPKIDPYALETVYGVEKCVRESGLEPALLELAKLRASQINDCGFCVDLHRKEARARGESEQRLYAVAVWRDTPFFTDRERAALA